MRLQERLEALTLGAARRPRATIGVVLALALLGGLLALGLRPSAATDTFVGRSSPAFRATAEDQRHFGSDPVVILVREPLSDLVETKDLGTLTELEACLAGETVTANQSLSAFTANPAGSTPAYGGPRSPCGQLMRHRPAQVVYGPGTFLNQAVAAINRRVRAMLAGVRQNVTAREQQAYATAISEHLGAAAARQAAAAAGQAATQQDETSLAQFYLNSGISGLPRIDDASFIQQIVFDATRGVYEPKARFAYLFPSSRAALIQVRLRAGLSPEAQSRAIGWIRQAVRMPMFRLAYGGRYTVSGVPVVTNDLAASLAGQVLALLLVAVGVMALALLVVFRRRLRLLPLLIALAASGITFGLLAAVGASLTIADVAVLPVLIGLAVDYAIQFGSRAAERARGGSGISLHTLATAALATSAGFLVLLLSPVPMVGGFALLLAVGILVALLCALTLGPAALALADGDGGAVGAALRGAAEILAPLGAGARRALRGAGAAVSAAVPRRGGGALRRGGGMLRAAGRAAAAHPGRLLALGGALAVLGWAADTSLPVQSDVTKLVPPAMPALRNLHTLERVTGVSGEIDVLIHARDITQPGVVEWMTSYEQGLLAHYGYVETRGCSASTLCPALSLPDLFSAGQSSAAGTRGLSAAQIRGVLSAVPPYFSQAVISPDRREATLAFGIRLMPLARQQRVIEYMRSRLHPPAGATATLTGLPVLAAQADADLSSAGERLLSVLLGLVAVGIVLLLILRDRVRALVPLVPIVLATGWSALGLWAVGIPLNPMSSTLGTLVIAISTEFSVLLSERYHAERRRGHGSEAALRRTLASTGRAVLASGLTAIAGFAVLVVSGITMLRDFGVVTLIDLTVSLGGVLLVLPAALALAERDLSVPPLGEAPELLRRVSAGLRPRRRARALG